MTIVVVIVLEEIDIHHDQGTKAFDYVWNALMDILPVQTALDTLTGSSTFLVRQKGLAKDGGLLALVPF